MPRSYRLIIIAAFGCLAVAAAPQPNHRNQRQGERASSPNEAAPAQPLVVKTISGDPSDAGCQNGKDDRQSDLCAQWKAADAADSGAQATWIFGALGSLIASATLIAAIMAARYARDAAKETRRGASAAEDAVLQTRRIGESQIRAYLSIESLEAEWGHNTIAVKPVILNSGQSPARDVYVGVWATKDALPLKLFDKLFPGEFGQKHLASGAENTRLPYFFAVADNDTAQHMAINSAVLIVTVISYRDVFGDRYLSRASAFAIRPERGTIAMLNIAEQDEQKY